MFVPETFLTFRSASTPRHFRIKLLCLHQRMEKIQMKIFHGPVWILKKLAPFPLMGMLNELVTAVGGRLV
jgi:hypothetical protein